MTKIDGAIGKKKGSGLRNVLTPEMVQTYAEKGMSFTEIARMYGYTKERIGQIIGKDDELQEAWQTGNATLCDTLTSALMRLVEKDNLVAIIFALKARCGWVEQQYLLNKPDTTTQPQVSIYLPDNNRNHTSISIDDSVNELPL